MAALALAPSAMAQVSLDLNLGYAIPTGKVTRLTPMTEVWSGAIPIGVAARFRFTSNLSAGIYFQYGPAFVASHSCGEGASCSGYDMRTGIAVAWGFLPDGGMNPWVSLGTGWEWSEVSATLGGSSESSSVNGWEYFNVQVGLDFPLGTAFALGPYLGYSGGTYTNTPSASSFGSSIPSESRAFHGWLQFGVKGTLNL